MDIYYMRVCLVCIFLPLLTLELSQEHKSSSLQHSTKQNATNTKVSQSDPNVIEIPEGAFFMGSRASMGKKNEHPYHEVWLSRYWIDKFEVTVGSFRQYCTATKYKYQWELMEPYWRYHDDYPMVRVTWKEAQDYCKWVGGDLPTEAEWEKAARGTDGRTYLWNTDWDTSKCINFESSQGHPSKGGTCATDKSPYGVMDMAGNVTEWCRDWYDKDYYASSPKKEPSGPSEGKYRVIRGGNWGDLLGIPDSFRCAYRDRIGPKAAVFYIGFRCVYHEPIRKSRQQKNY